MDLLKWFKPEVEEHEEVVYESYAPHLKPQYRIMTDNVDYWPEILCQKMVRTTRQVRKFARAHWEYEHSPWEVSGLVYRPVVAVACTTCYPRGVPYRYSNDLLSSNSIFFRSTCGEVQGMIDGWMRAYEEWWAIEKLRHPVAVEITCHPTQGDSK